MGNKRFISASEIGLYTFCPRAWVLKELEYEPDNQWELDEGKRFHEETGRRELEKAAEEGPKLELRKRQIRAVSILMTVILICLLLVLIRMILK